MPLIAARVRSMSLKPSADAVIVAVVELGKIPMQMLLFAMLINAAHSALEDREIAFRRIGVDGFGRRRSSDTRPDIFASGVLDRLVRLEQSCRRRDRGCFRRYAVATRWAIFSRDDLANVLPCRRRAHGTCGRCRRAQRGPR